MTVGDVVRDLLSDPVRVVICRWHWKSAALSVCLRSTLFFATNTPSGVRAAASAALIECALAAPLVGVLAAVVQQFRSVEPAWSATLVTALVVPAVAQSMEALVHWIAGTPRLGASLLASLALSTMSTLFSLFAMRRGVLIVGRGSRRFADDMRELPRTMARFVLAVPMWRR